MSTRVDEPELPGLQIIGEPDHPDLEHWHGNVGQPVSLDLAPPLTVRPAQVLVLCWNLAIGAARLEVLMRWLEAGLHDLPIDTAAQPLVIVAQEAYRHAPELAAPRGRFHGGAHGRAPRSDVLDVAREHGLSLRYVPSMRNGAHPSDRGNAVLASAALTPARGFLLPYVRQRRVAIAAELQGLPRLTFASAHLDTGGRVRAAGAGRGFGAGRRLQAEAVAARLLAAGDGHDLVVGADLNSPLGLRDPAYRALLRSGFRAARHASRWRHTFHGPLGLRLPLDHVVYLAAGEVEDVEVYRLDERASDRGARVFGSDHHPLLARVRLTDAAGAALARPAPA